MRPQATLPGGFPAATFVRDYWQKQPLLVRNAFTGLDSLLSADELAGLACEEEVESRLVRGSLGNSWSLQHGPLLESDFASLPSREWTLLVQAVDQWVPEVAAWLDHFNFLPRWQLDDVMVSFAADGGSVGPHFDNYDVFLVQAEGRRRWKLGQMCDEFSPVEAGLPLRILSEFDTQQEYLLEPGDMLYLPPRLAHWGVAEGHCMTWSVGYRAPSAAEWLEEYVRQAIDSGQVSTVPVLLAADWENDPFRISPTSTDSAALLLPALPGARDLLLHSLGALATRPRYPDLIDQMAESNREQGVEPIGAKSLALARNPHSRFCYFPDGDAALLFVDGQCHPTNLESAIYICLNKLILIDNISDQRDLIQRLFDAGALFVER